MTCSRMARALAVGGLVALATACGGSAPESDFVWEEEVIAGPEEPPPREPEPAPPPPRRAEQDRPRYEEPAPARRPSARREDGERGEALYAPRERTICDELVAACYVEGEVHLGHTSKQFGRDATVALERRAARGPKARDGVYQPVGGAVCDRLSKVCYDRLGASASLTHTEFGRAAAVRLAERVE